jgi:pyridoxamine 5'-phosphate oxidase
MESLKSHIQSHRRDYIGQQLDEKNVSASPLMQFESWMLEAINKKINDVNAMILATADKEGTPSVRTVLLRDFNEKGFTFYTNYNSKKGKEIDENPKASLLFFWPELHRQIRVDGILEKVSPEVSEQYFKVRPFDSKISAWISPQSAVVQDKEVLEKSFDAFREKYEGKEIPYPAFWGGYNLIPHTYEFWQGQPVRLHDRVMYKKDDEGNWKIMRLAP